MQYMPHWHGCIGMGKLVRIGMSMSIHVKEDIYCMYAFIMCSITQGIQRRPYWCSPSTCLLTSLSTPFISQFLSNFKHQLTVCKVMDGLCHELYMLVWNQVKSLWLKHAWLPVLTCLSTRQMTSVDKPALHYTHNKFTTWLKFSTDTPNSEYVDPNSSRYGTPWLEVPSVQEAVQHESWNLT